MSRKRNQKLSLPIILVVILLGLAWAWFQSDRDKPDGQVAPPAGDGSAQSCLFCFWNVENLFDDHDDDYPHKADQEYDDWFSHDKEALQLKLARLSEVLLKLNDGKGPDIIALAEVESRRAAELLAEALNAKLTDPALHYQHVLMKEPTGGRHIATAILTRLPVRGDKTQTHGRRLRILEGHVVVNGHDLAIIAAHWTSRVSDDDGSQRDKYADQIYGVVRGMYQSNPAADVLICGDFNDPPDAPSVTQHLHAVGDREKVRSAENGPLLLNLFADKDPNRFGTHHYKSNFFIFDQIVASPGLLDDEGWKCDPDSTQTVNAPHRPNAKQHRPWSFGKEKEKDPRKRGYSDHFPVTVRLKVGEAPR